MRSAENPYSPGAGNPQPELAGREEILDRASSTLERTLNRRMTKSLMMLGLRGVGKTVLLNRIQQMADDAGCVTGFIEAEGKQALPDLLTPHLWRILLKLDTQKLARESVHRAFRLLRGFASAFSVQFGGIEVAVKPETSTGDLSLDVTDLLVAVGEAAAQRGSPVVILVDEVQYLSRDELSAIMVALHKVSQKQLPLLLFGAGLPQLAALAGEAKSYAERLFFFNEIGRLSNEAARTAIMEPLRQENVGIDGDALEAILAETDCYPFFLQLWGYYAWESAEASLISVEDVNAATDMSIEDLDQGFFNIRYQRLTDRQRDYVFALARLGPGPASSTAVAAELGVPVEKAASVRSEVIKKGVAYSPRWGLIAFTVPKFDEYLRRVESMRE
jgi:hypothetical protein